MKYNAETIEVGKFNFNPKLVKSGVFNEINENQNLTPFPYAHPDNKDLFKLVLHWDIILKTADLKNKILDMEAEQEFKILFDGNDDKTILKNLISTSHLHLQEEITKGLKSSAIKDFRLLAINEDEAANNILSSVGRL